MDATTLPILGLQYDFYSTKISVKRKRSASALLAAIPPPESIRFKPMESLHRPPAVNLTSDTDPRNPYHTPYSLSISQSL
ncbi:hypothetical protein ACJ73_08583 [Blastomyces percursus]|uniref:Uncharacterized protein n=1 Tax=Blastomyces percursus TaxID=1658174 RepID=A0A1J9QW52_9EURO|nr:hypothetical protein ACJ73_08583 [Blastomyces percursus]